jgi:hypothetical protein
MNKVLVVERYPETRANFNWAARRKEPNGGGHLHAEYS